MSTNGLRRVTNPAGATIIGWIGHRGASAHAPDNTLAGLHKAAELGADRVEIDLQRTNDGHLVEG